MAECGVGVVVVGVVTLPCSNGTDVRKEDRVGRELWVTEVAVGLYYVLSFFISLVIFLLVVTEIGGVGRWVERV